MDRDRRPRSSTDFEMFTDHARHLRMPVLLVRGRMSDVVSEETAHEFLQLVPQARYADVGGARHMVAGDRNDSFTASIVEFLADLSPS